MSQSQSQMAARFPSRTMPHPDLVAHAARMRRWMYTMIGGTALVALVFVGVQIMLLKSMSKPPRVEAPPDAPPGSSPTLSYIPGLTPSRPYAPQESPTVLAQEPLLEVIGGMTGAHLYQTYLNIGLLADAAENELYTVAEAKKVLETINNLIDIVEKQLIQVPPSSFKDEEDRKEMELARNVTTLLRLQTKELKAYWESDDNENAMRFQTAREEAWWGIKKLARIQE